MTLPNNIAVYNDCRQVMDATLDAGGGNYYLPTKPGAERWRFRAYKFRNLHRKLYAGTSIYDVLTISVPKYDETRKEWRVQLTSQTAIIGTFIPHGSDAEFKPSPLNKVYDITPDFESAAKLLEE
jgi:hypothetical protein